MEFSEEELLVLETLKRATSQNVDVLKLAEHKLTQWEVEPGFYSILLKIICNHYIDVTLRWMAVTFLKNGVDRYWRKSVPNAIKDEEKMSLRNGLMETFREPINQVAIQLAVLISKAARYDCPSEWPELIPKLLEVSKTDDLLMQHRGLLTLYHVIKMLASKRLGGDRKLFQHLSGNIYSYILSLWDSHYENFFTQIQNNDLQYQATLERALLSLKILRKLTVNGFKEPHQHPDIVQFMTNLYDRIRRMLYFRKTMENKSSPLMELTEKTIIHMMKVLLSVLEYFPTSFINFIRPSLEFTVTCLFTEHGDGLLFEKFIVQCMNLLKSMILSYKRKNSKYSENRKGPEALEAERVLVEFFQVNTLAEICRKLITHYFLLTKEDLQLWDSDPERFEGATSDDAAESWKIILRDCTYSLFVALFREYREALSPVLLELIQNNHQLVNPQDIDAILRKDAVYNAVGLTAFDLYDEVDFDQWFSTTLLQELSIKEPNYRVIRRRVAWLIGQWVGIKLSPELRPTLYSALIPLLCAYEDMDVRLSAAVALKHAVDDFQFDPEQFLEFLEPAFVFLFALLQEVEECDTKLQILYVLSFIVERMGTAVKPFSQSLIRYLPMLWDESVNHNMLRCAIVETVVRFVKARMTDNLTSFLYSVIELCTDLKQDAHVYLLEEGLELWHAVLDNSTTLSPELLQLYRAMPSVLETGQENLRCCSFIIQAYILLGPQQFLMEYGESVVASCLNLITDLDTDGILIVMQIIETAIRANTSLAINLSMPILSNILLNICREEYCPRLMSMYLAIICRVLLYSRDVFSQLIGNTARDKSESSEKFLEKVLAVWLRTMPVVIQKEKRKLLALALSSLLTEGSGLVMAQFQLILSNIVEALNDIVDMDGFMTPIDSLMLSEEFTSSDDLDPQQETENDRRKKLLMETDPIYNIELKSYFQSQVDDLKNKIGATNFERLMQLIDSETLEQCKLYITI